MQYYISCGDFKDLTRRTASNKMLRGKAFNIAKNPNYDGYQKYFPSIVYKVFDKTFYGGDIKNENMSNQELAKELLKQIINKFKNETYNHLL